MHDDVEADEQGNSGGAQPDRADELAAHVVARPADVLLPSFPQQERHPEDGTEHDQLLAHRVEPAIVEDDRGDDVRGMPLFDGGVVEERRVGARLRAEVRQPGSCPDEQRAEPEGAGAEQEESLPASHSRSFAIATTITSG